MKSAIKLSLSLIALVALCIFLPVPASRAVTRDAVSVRQAVASFATDWNHHDMVAFGRLFAKDADFVNVIGSHWVGRQQIQEHHAWSHGAIPENSHIEASTHVYGIFRHSTITFAHIQVRFLRKDVALAHVDWVLRGDSRTQNSRHGILSFVLTRENDGWLVASAQNTEINRTVK